MPMQYPEEFKKQITAICAAGTPLTVISEKYHVSLNTLYRWRKEHRLTENQNTTNDVSVLRRQSNVKATSCKSFDSPISLKMSPDANAWKFWQG